MLGLKLNHISKRGHSKQFQLACQFHHICIIYASRGLNKLTHISAGIAGMFSFLLSSRRHWYICCDGLCYPSSWVDLSLEIDMLITWGRWSAGHQYQAPQLNIDLNQLLLTAGDQPGKWGHILQPTWPIWMSHECHGISNHYYLFS